MDKITQQIKQEIANDKRLSQFNYSKIPAHEHNGVDTVKISQANIINNNKVTTFLIVTSPSTLTIPNIPNLSTIVFSGFAANNASGSATKRFILNGQAEIGNTYYYASTGGETAIPQDIISIANYMYVDQTDLTKNRVGATNGLIVSGVYQAYLVSCNDDSGTLIAEMKVTYTNSLVTFNIDTLASGWKLQGALILK